MFTTAAKRIVHVSLISATVLAYGAFAPSTASASLAAWDAQSASCSGTVEVSTYDGTMTLVPGTNRNNGVIPGDLNSRGNFTWQCVTAAGRTAHTAHCDDAEAVTTGIALWIDAAILRVAC